jgi:hypothetical protein
MRNRIPENAVDKERTLPTIVPVSAGQQLGMELCDLQSSSECASSSKALSNGAEAYVVQDRLM